MSNHYITEQMVEMFIYETTQNIEQLEQEIVLCEANGFVPSAVNEILRNMHTIKGSSAMMFYTSIATLSHSLEDLFFFLRENKPEEVDYSTLSDLVLEGIDFIKVELHKIKSKEPVDGDASGLIETINQFLAAVKGTNAKPPAQDTGPEETMTKLEQAHEAEWELNRSVSVRTRTVAHRLGYEATIHFEDGCEMENVRAYGIVHSLQELASDMVCDPPDYIENEASIQTIRKQGFAIRFQSSEPYDVVHNRISDTLFLRSLTLSVIRENRPQTEYKANLRFEDGCEMENIRAFGVVHALKQIAWGIACDPEDYVENEASIPFIREQGFTVTFKTNESYERIAKLFEDTLFLSELKLEQEPEQLDETLCATQEAGSDQLTKPSPEVTVPSSGKPEAEAQKPDTQKPDTQKPKAKTPKKETSDHSSPAGQSLISVNIEKLDRLMDLVGEMVIAEAMVTQNPDLQGLQLDRFHKAAQLLHKITSELQDVVMSIRMVPLSATFQKMHRIVRDMCKNLGKEVQLKLIGEETEVDKNVIQHISDPLMHLIRNSIDHGIELPEHRDAAGKARAGVVTLEAKNAGGDVYVIIKDDGKGLSKEKLLEKARKNGLLTKPEEEMTDKEIFGLIFLPGFSTKEAISEYSGRGVGMDVVSQNISAIGGSISVDSAEGSGTTITLKIQLTLAIIDGMTMRVGTSRYTIPTNAIVESFRPKERDIIRDPDDREMIMVRGQCYPILRLHRLYGVKSDTTQFHEGILIMTQHDDQAFCLFADELIGQQQVVVKALPEYIKRMRNIQGLAGCTLLGDGSISLILDPGALSARG
ncbi:two-component system chemotaxis sensor kinase CheA [Paenibacillus phyllosphaerae]|uniref:Chemotaxis protein CheA n=1 Tax=Paenibacillus phyllosphaerae TaxID=274593 RepID=A0A7W5FM77_9BACL|nr:chemotaxis protein CheA [Paenibacillus phyllosphaerae]MBB3109813.1 two-component system chemotaxis sensor kinase CheA [Paenibacillus phyllosphaerae]